MKRIHNLLLIFAMVLLQHGAYAQTQLTSAERSIRFAITINAPLDSVWKSWTTVEGIKSFLAPACELELKPLGKYNILFNPEAPVGQRGAEGNFIMAIQEKSMLTFSWDAPPMWPEIRKQRTLVVLRFSELSNHQTTLTFTQTGWGTTSEWDQVFNYFGKAWGERVLPFLKYRHEVKPVDWKNPPQGLMAAKRIEH